MLRQAQQTYRCLRAFPEPVEGFPVFKLIYKHTPLFFAVLYLKGCKP